MELRASGDYKGVFKVFDLAIHVNPMNPEEYLNRGATYEMLGDTGMAIKDEQKAIELANKNSEECLTARCLVHQNLAGIYLKRNEIKKAETEARAAVNLCPDEA